MSARFYFKQGDAVRGPVPTAELRTLAEAGEIDVTTLICPEDGEDWSEFGSTELPAEEEVPTQHLVGEALPLVLTIAVAAWMWWAQQATVLLEPMALHIAVKSGYLLYLLMALILFRFVGLGRVNFWIYLAAGAAVAAWMTVSLPH